MKRIISGKRYDTETATRLAGVQFGESRSDFRYFEEALYLTASGNWFLAGEAHGMSKYASNGTPGTMGGYDEGLRGPFSWGEGIIPLEASQAQDGLEVNAFTELLETHFGDQLEVA